MPSPFLSSEEYDERAHQLYNEGEYEAALATLREGLALYPNAVELHVGVGYARLARDEYAWARRAFEEALLLDAEHEDALAGLGETLLKFGQTPQALKAFRRILDLGYGDDVELMLQVGRTCFREGLAAEAKEFFEVALRQVPDHAEAVAMVGYAEHRLGQDDAAVETLRRALQLDPAHAEARIYLGNLLYDREEFEAALFQLEQTKPDEHWDELGIWRLLELKKSHCRMQDGDPAFQPWEARLEELAPPADSIDELLAELEARAAEREEVEARQQLELFGALLAGAADAKQAPPEAHRVVARDGRRYEGSWEEIVVAMRDAADGERPLDEFMQAEARRGFALTGRLIPTKDAESFLRASADAGLLRIVS
ncbi:MAG: tetratricopeptide repeat protein [Gemmatimonadota bacterium]|jgi:Flp pilus assembly protein TadD|nr:tetratricopeptide repeat protein [Gemmatimonadota bacterium]MDQ8147013.1 tetratricopeptide repeat protein [Gemmatimonadota bacterium]MDQ8148736.1 tetratricopeptide repeat protein [Gemmatimonadota bacterium]MDQ8156144.1 tetratricopeptide repeat protein [Gemmatimonadota bacterium]MDQ8176428.1 tetratricopeptide repeat protein [Gemmatimonadota bacterium]